ncbi:MAG TPA: type II toxin-antitoxin system RelE/ParE family toxin [Azospirillaceae bacterium]|nr:type II toxin-antitoxin system RelE/ParE family toxin [Azospirillaceae bacterium]
MPYRLVYSPEAIDDLADIKRYHAQGGRIALRRVEHILRAARELAEAPLRWPVDDRDPGLRMRVVEGHRIRYAVDAGRRLVYIVRVRGPWQDLP